MPHRSLVVFAPSLFLLVLLLLVPLAAGARATDDATVLVLPAAGERPDGFWVEVTSLAAAAGGSGAADGAGGGAGGGAGDRDAAWLLHPEADDLRLLPPLPAGPAMLCTGAPATATTCRLGTIWRADAESLLPPPATLEWRVEPVDGPPVRGRYLVGDLPVEGARVAVVPAGLEVGTPFLVPLAVDDSVEDPVDDTAPMREVRSDEEGLFRLPRLAPGEYFLETVLPGGRVHRSDPFAVPPLAELGEDAGGVAEEDLVFDLGDVDVSRGLRLEIRAVDVRGTPLPGVRVSARQGSRPGDLVTFGVRTGDEGRAVLDGLSVDGELVLSCAAPGYASWRRSWDLLPTVVTCELEELAAIAGEVSTSGGERVPGAVVSLFPADVLGEVSDDAGAVARRTVGEDGTYHFEGVEAGTWSLAAAAPGRRVERVALDLEPGERRLLEPLVLLPGREVLLRAVERPEPATEMPFDAALGESDPREPVAGAEIVALEPAGAVRAVTDGDGEARFAHPGERVRLAVRAVERATEIVEVPADADGPLVVEMEPGGWIAVTLRSVAPAIAGDGPADAPCAGCRVVIRPGRGGEEIRLETDGRGEAVSEPLAPGVYRVLRPRHDHLGSTVVETPDAEEKTVRVEAGEIRRVAFEAPEPSLRVRIEPPPGPEVSLSEWMLLVRSAGRTQRLAAEADGTFAVDRRGREPLDLYLERWHEPSDARMEMRVARVGTEAVESPLVVRLPTARVHGGVTRNEQPAAGVNVRLVDFRDGSLAARMRTGPDGRFDFPHLQRGVYGLRLGELTFNFLSLQAGQAVDAGVFRLP